MRIDFAAEATPRWAVVGIALGLYVAAIPLLPTRTAAALVSPLLLIPICWWTLATANRWIAAFIGPALLLPPIPIALGNSGPHICLLFAALGLVAGMLRLPDWHVRPNGLTFAAALFFLALLFSVPFAALYSGSGVASASLARVFLFGIGLYVFYYVAHGPWNGERFRATRLLFWAAVASALIACFDFYYQLPAPAGYGPQFVWLQSGVYRRAQGVFYEASTLGNFCAFFLVMIAVAMTRPRHEAPVSRRALLAGGIIFSAALVFSYSRASVANVIVAAVVLLYLNRQRFRLKRAMALLASSIAAGAMISYVLFPAFVGIYWRRLSGSAVYFSEYTEGILSGRLESWRTLGGFLMEKPWHAIFGIGYKTLPYSDFIGRPVVADNMYLSILAETGLVGLTALILFNVAILRAAYRAARSTDRRASFFGTWIFCFWTGQLLQMLSGDLLTYWRVLPVYFLVLAWAVRQDEHSLSRSVQ